MMPSNPPTVCTLGAEDLDVREEGWRAVAHAALRVRVATSTGVRLEFAPDHAIAHALLDLVAAERGCCAWASWTLTSTLDATVLEAQADESGTTALQAMFEVGPSKH